MTFRFGKTEGFERIEKLCFMNYLYYLIYILFIHKKYSLYKFFATMWKNILESVKSVNAYEILRYIALRQRNFLSLDNISKKLKYK